MKKAILATKVGMTQIFDENGVLVPVTVLQAGPCVVTQVKTADNDGYSAIQVGFGEKKENRVNKPMKGQFAKAGVSCKRYLKEFRFEDAETIGLCLVGVVIGEFIGAREGLGYLIIYGSQVFRYAHAREGRMTDDWNRMSGRTKRNAVWRTTRFAGPRGNGKNLRTV